MSRFKEDLCSASLLILLAGCTTVPITGRSQLNMVSDQQVLAAANETFSQFMAVAHQKNAVLLPSESAQAASLVASVNRVSERIIDAAGLRGRVDWQTVIVKSPKANAMVMPNGKIIVFDGLLAVAKTEAGMAAVISHEVAHVFARHQAERLSHALLVQLGLTATEVALAASSKSNSQYRPVISAALGLGALYGVLLPFSRVHESEADRIGLFLMAKAGYDPAEAIGLWERMEAAGGSGPWEFLSTHPSPATRRTNIREWLPEANVYYADRTRPLPATLSEVQAARAEQASRIALAPVASQPALQPGFWYRFNSSNRPGPTTYRFNRRESCSAGECMILTGDGGGRVTYTPEHGIVEIQNSNGSWTRFSPPLRLIRFPLHVGDSWTDTLVIEESSGRRQNARLKADVVTYESVAVPAGPFMAFKIIVSLNGVRYREAWYAPETRTSVRSVTYDSRGAQVVSELTDYQKTEEPAGPMAANEPAPTGPSARSEAYALPDPSKAVQRPTREEIEAKVGKVETPSSPEPTLARPAPVSPSPAPKQREAEPSRRASRRPDQGAVITTDGARVYAQMAVTREVLASLRQGMRVTVDMAILGPEGDWCLITISERPKRAGYVLCDDLDGRPRSRGWRRR